MAQSQVIQQAIEILKNDGIVSLPTETVYGLAGSIRSELALKKIFEIKKRPFFDPLIVHVSSQQQAKTLFKEWTPLMEALATSFWPGPLTLVAKKAPQVSSLITSGLETVGVRMPLHELALDLISAFGEPLAAPSANRFGKTSPTCAEHVQSEFESESLFILDGGACSVGIESTILYVSQESQCAELEILRQGMINQLQLTDKLVRSGFRQGTDFKFVSKVSAMMAPGKMKHHYMPSKPLILLKTSALTDQQILHSIKDQLSKMPDIVEGVQIVKPQQVLKMTPLILDNDSVLAARMLYSELRKRAEKEGDILLFKVLEHHESPEWAPIFDRLLKAASLIL